MLRNLYFRAPEDALIDCWTVGDLRPEVCAAAVAAEQAEIPSPPTARVPDLAAAADYMRWIDSEHRLGDSGSIAAFDYERALSA